MDASTLKTDDRFGFSYDITHGGPFVLVGETVPMLVADSNVMDDSEVAARFSGALREMLLFIGTEYGPEKLVSYLAARGVSARVEIDDGRTISRGSSSLPDLAIGAP